MTDMVGYSDDTLKKQGIGMIAGLTIEYLLGMYANIFVQFPEKKQPGQYWVFAWRQLPIELHIIIGFLLFFGAVFFLIRAMRSKNRTWIISSSVALFGIAGAVIGGLVFIPTQTNSFSFFMAISFIIAVLSYMWGIYTTK